MAQPVILYDIPNTLPVAERSWSPNTLKIRYTLNYKRIPYKTVWVEYPDIKALSLEIGAQPTSFDDAGVGEYTLPTIRDPELGTVTNSYDIALALDKRYPERPVVPAGTAALQVAWHGAIWQFIHRDLYALAEYGVYEKLPERSQEFFRRTREEGGRTLEEKAPSGEKRKEHFAKLKHGFGRLAAHMDRNPEGSLFVMGDTISYADFVVVSWLTWAKRAIPAEEFAEIMTWDGGRWQRILETLREYETVDEGEVYHPQSA